MKKEFNGLRAGGEPLDIQFIEQAFPANTTQKPANTFSPDAIATGVNHSIRVAANANSLTDGGAFWATIRKEDHYNGGQLSIGGIGGIIESKEDSRSFTIIDTDKSVPYAHRYCLDPADKTKIGLVSEGVEYALATNTNTKTDD